MEKGSWKRMYPTRQIAQVVLLLLLATTWLAGAPQTRPEDLKPIRILPPQPREPLVRAGPEPDLEILFTSEVRGFYQPCG